MRRCQPGCTCGRHASYVRTSEHRAALSAKRKGVVLQALTERFWAKVQKGEPDSCWLWTGACYLSGYGKLYAGRVDGKMLAHYAHRLSWELDHGHPVPDAGKILHRCDNPPCVNPAHLYLGTPADNARDRGERRRGKEHRQHGEANDNAKLTEVQVRAIIVELQRLPRRSQASIAEQFGIKQPQVSRIMRRVNWAHLWDE